MIRFLFLFLWWGRNDCHFNQICSSALVFCIQPLLLFWLFVMVEFPFRIFEKGILTQRLSFSYFLFWSWRPWIAVYLSSVFFIFSFYTMNRCSDPVPKQFKVLAPAGHTFQGSLNCQRLSLLVEPFVRYTQYISPWRLLTAQLGISLGWQLSSLFLCKYSSNFTLFVLSLAFDTNPAAVIVDSANLASKFSEAVREEK
jgi:hypothetical protein